MKKRDVGGGRFQNGSGKYIVRKEGKCVSRDIGKCRIQVVGFGNHSILRQSDLILTREQRSVEIMFCRSFHMNFLVMLIFGHSSEPSGLNECRRA